MQVSWLQAKLFRTTCCEDFIHLKKEVEYHDLCLPLELFASSNKVSSTIRPVAQADIQKLLNACHPQIKEIFLHCLRKNNLLLHVLGEEDDSKIRHVTNMGYLFSTSSIPRRNPGRVLLQLISEPPGLGPTVGSPTPSLTPSPEPSLPPSPEPSLSPSPAPAPPLPKPLSPPLSPSSFFPKLTPPPAADISAPPSSDTNGKEDNHSNKTTVVLSVVITLSVIFAAALFFLCFRKAGRRRQNDERPLLSLSMNDYSFGTYYITFHFIHSLLMCYTCCDINFIIQVLPIMLLKIQQKGRNLGFSHQVII